jgi:hypothetical protein
MATVKARDLKAGMWFMQPDTMSKGPTRVMTNPEPFDSLFPGPHVILELDDRHQDPYVHSFAADRELELAEWPDTVAECLFS